MKEARFQTLVTPLSVCPDFSTFLEQIGPTAEALLGGGEYGVITCDLRRHDFRIEGAAADLPSMPRIAQIFKEQMKIGGAVSEGCFSEQSIRVARLCKGAFFSCFLVGVKRVNGFSAEQSEFFASLGLFCEQLIGRLSLLSHHDQLNRQLLAFRSECALAHFQFEPEQGLMPLNHAATTYSAKRWGQDVRVFTPSEEMRERLDQVMTASWHTPIEAHWSVMELDLGGGKFGVHVLPMVRGDATVLLKMRADEGAGVSGSGCLTKRQDEIMKWISEGKSSAEVAVILGISPRTVEKHLEVVFQRLGVENRITAVRRYLELKGLIEL